MGDEKTPDLDGPRKIRCRRIESMVGQTLVARMMLLFEAMGA
jgi:hypothetical protein